MPLSKLETWEYNKKPLLNQAEDICYYIWKYNPNSEVNESVHSFVKNFKRNPQELQGNTFFPKYKSQSINKAAHELSLICNRLEDNNKFKDSIWLPIPPSKSKADPLYDDRLVKVLESINSSFRLKFHDIFSTINSTESSHKSNERDVQLKIDNITCNSHGIELLKNNANFIVFDDIITSGASFKALKTIIQSNNPDANVIGLFLCKTYYPNS